jgi:hypothetical protein
MLGHASPDMTATYARIFDDTLKKEYAAFRGRTVDVQGRVVAEEGPVSETGWLRKNVLAQALPNGTCALPVAQKECPHANACLTCGFFRTNASFLPEHRQQLIRSWLWRRRKAGAAKWR